jgi:hypothetical protein
MNNQCCDQFFSAKNRTLSQNRHFFRRKNKKFHNIDPGTSLRRRRIQSKCQLSSLGVAAAHFYTEADRSKSESCCFRGHALMRPVLQAKLCSLMDRFVAETFFYISRKRASLGPALQALEQGCASRTEGGS